MGFFDFEIKGIELDVNAVTLLENGKYKAQIYGSEIKSTKKAEELGTDDCYLQLMVKVLHGNSLGKMIWDRMNIKNGNETAQNIGRAKLKVIANILGIDEVSGSPTSILHDKDIGVIIGREDGFDGNQRNIIKSYFAVEKPKDVEVVSEKNDEFNDDIPF